MMSEATENYAPAHHDDELNAPEWLDKQFIEDILQKSESDKTIAVTDIQIKPAVALGEHMASILYRVRATYSTGRSLESKSKSLIVKTMPFGKGLIRDMLEETSIFETESKMYSKTIPEMETLYAENGITESFAPKMLYWSLDPYKVIVFEDISPEGYATIPQLIDFGKSKILAKRLARFHAASYVLNATDGDVKDYVDGICGDKFFKTFQPFLFTALSSFINFLNSVPEFEQYKGQFSPLLDGSLAKKLNRLYTDTSTPIYNVLNHGDFHVKNIMWKHDEKGQVVDVKLVDHQLSVYGSPAIDVIYLLYAQSSSDVRINHRSELIYYYYQEFESALKELKFDGHIPTLHDLNMEILRNGFFEVYMVGTMLSFLSIDLREFGKDLKEMMENPLGPKAEEVKLKIYNTPVFKNEVLKLIPEFVHKGFI